MEPVWNYFPGPSLHQGQGEPFGNPQSRPNAASIFVPTVMYPSLVPKPSDESSPSGGTMVDAVPLSEPDLTKQPTRSALKGGKKKGLSKELEVKLQERRSLTENASPRSSGAGGFTDGTNNRPRSGSGGTGGAVKFGATEEHLTTPTGIFIAGQVPAVSAYVLVMFCVFYVQQTTTGGLQHSLPFRFFDNDHALTSVSIEFVLLMAIEVYG